MTPEVKAAIDNANAAWSSAHAAWAALGAAWAGVIINTIVVIAAFAVQYNQRRLDREDEKRDRAVNNILVLIDCIKVLEYTSELLKDLVFMEENAGGIYGNAKSYNLYIKLEAGAKKIASIMSLRKLGTGAIGVSHQTISLATLIVRHVEAVSTGPMLGERGFVVLREVLTDLRGSVAGIRAGAVSSLRAIASKPEGRWARTEIENAAADPAEIKGLLASVLGPTR